jgi:hypothetical protein
MPDTTCLSCKVQAVKSRAEIAILATRTWRDDTIYITVHSDARSSAKLPVVGAKSNLSRRGVVGCRAATPSLIWLRFAVPEMAESTPPQTPRDDVSTPRDGEEGSMTPRSEASSFLITTRGTRKWKRQVVNENLDDSACFFFLMSLPCSVIKKFWHFVFPTWI